MAPHALLLLLLAAASAQIIPSKPNVLFILVDDLGHAELGYHRPPGYHEVQTPSIDALVAEGINLDRHYVHKFCSPTRCAIQSGRAPIHVNVINAAPEVSNRADPVSGFAGMPKNMTGIAQVMKRAGYATHFAGKWDVGMATPTHTPVGRGYDTTLHYFHHSNDYWTYRDGGSCNKVNDVGDTMVDFWNKYSNVSEPYGKPAVNKVNSPGCTQRNQTDWKTCVYEDDHFTERVTDVIQASNADKDEPFFVFWATHIVHGPLQVPDAQFAKFDFIDNTQRRMYHSMVNYIDTAIGDVVAVAKAFGHWDNTLIIFSSDNGGPLPSGNNYPLKGGKFSNWEGGIRVNAFVSGGILPPSVRGTTSTQLVAGWDWYATLAALAGEDPTDHAAAAAGLPSIDSHNLAPMIFGVNATSPRTRLEIGSNLGGDEANRTSGPTVVGGIIRPPYKIIVGDGPGNVLDNVCWPGPESPNNTKGSCDAKNRTEVCARTPATGCLFNVWADPEEHSNLASSMPELFKSMLAEMDQVQSTVFSPERGTADPAACAAAVKYGGFWGPFIDTD